MVNTCDNVKIWRQQQVVNVKSEDRKVNVTKHRTSRSLVAVDPRSPASRCEMRHKRETDKARLFSKFITSA